MRDRWLIIAAATLAACQPQVAEEPVVGPASDAVVIGTRHTIESAVLGEERAYQVFLPRRYDDDTHSPRPYPVMYVLDGSVHFASASGTVDFMSTGMNGNMQIPEMIVVTIPNTNRTRDLTPTHSTIGYDGEETEFLTPSGGGDQFLTFLEQELFPEVEANYRTLAHRTLVGHSFGGLFALHALVNRPELFHAYISIDPSLWWDEQKLVAEAENVFASESNRRALIYISMADHPGLEPGAPDVMQDTARRFADALATSPSAGLHSHLQLFSAEDHGSVPHLSLYHGLLSLFDGYKFTLDDILENPDALAEHFASVSDRLGVEFLPPEWVADELGNYVKDYMENPAAALALLQTNAANYPESANVFASLGVMYQVMDDRQAAIENLEKALAMDPDHDRVDRINETLQELRAE